MPKLNAKGIRQLAWNDLAAKQYWPFVGGNFVLTLILGAAIVVGVLLVVIPAAVVVAKAGDQMTSDILLKSILPISVFSCIAAVPILYGIGYMTWGGIRMALETANRTMKFEHCLSGWGHGWKMCWTILVVATYAQLWFLLLIVPGIVKAFAYAMTTYVQVEHPDWTATQCITESRRLMDGNKWRLFCLGFSFIGWYLLLVVAAFVPIAGNFAQYFLTPYVSTATARFYFEVKREKGCSSNT